MSDICVEGKERYIKLAPSKGSSFCRKETSPVSVGAHTSSSHLGPGGYFL